MVKTLILSEILRDEWKCSGSAGLEFLPEYHWGLQECSSSKRSVSFLLTRAQHLTSLTHHGRTEILLRSGPSAAQENNNVDDWEAYYVKIFADRDMFTRYTDFGVGHHAQYRLPTLLNQEPDIMGIQDLSNEYHDKHGPKLSDNRSEDSQTAAKGEMFEDDSSDDEEQPDSESDEDEMEDELPENEDEDDCSVLVSEF